MSDRYQDTGHAATDNMGSMPLEIDLAIHSTTGGRPTNVVDHAQRGAEVRCNCVRRRGSWSRLPLP